MTVHVWVTDETWGSRSARCMHCGVRPHDISAVGSECPGPQEKRKLTVDCVATGFAVLDSSKVKILPMIFEPALDSIRLTALEAKDHALRHRGMHVPSAIVEQAFDVFLHDCKLVEVRISYTPPDSEQ